MAKTVDTVREREQLKNSTLFCSEKNKKHQNHKNAKIVDIKIGIKRIGYLAKIRKRKLKYVFWLNRLSFLCVKDKYA